MVAHPCESHLRASFRSSFPLTYPTGNPNIQFRIELGATQMVEQTLVKAEHAKLH